MASVSVPAERPGGLLRRPHATTGFWSWFTTVDHKKIGILYGITAFAFFLIGGSEALLIRVQLARPDQRSQLDVLQPLDGLAARVEGVGFDDPAVAVGFVRRGIDVEARVHRVP